MAYFDSAKNRALWDKELAELRAKKQARANGNQKSANTNSINANNANTINMNAAKHQVSFEPERRPIDSQIDNYSADSFALAGQEIFRERITYKELLREEAESIRSLKASRTRTVQREYTNDEVLPSGGKF